ncbi:MAG TPA: hypothetical protein VIK89_16760 [Cytophagaceae bacterium]
MNRGDIYIIVAGLITGVIALLMSGCSPQFQQYDLAEEYATTLHYEGSSKGGGNEEDEDDGLVGMPAKNFYNGDLKRGAIWWAGKGIALEKGDVFIINAFNIGPDTTPFGATFPPLDLIIEPSVLKVSMRAESDDGSIPELHMQVDDAKGYKANGKSPVHKVSNKDEFQDYYFDLRDIYVQMFPKKHKVNGAMINSLKFFINPGQAGYTGRIYIKEIKVVPAKDVEGM